MPEAPQRDREQSMRRSVPVRFHSSGGYTRVFKTVFDQLDDPGTPSRVCMMASTLTHEVFIEPDLRKYVQQQKRALSERLIQRSHHNKQARLLPAEFDPELVVPIIITYLQGLRRQASGRLRSVRI
jgi:TetR/AcrR family transcriptional repressor of nem operon